GFVSHMRVDGRDNTDAAVNVRSHALHISGKSLDQIFAEHHKDVGHHADRLEQIENQHRLHHVQLELAGFRSKADRVVVADHLESHLVYYLGHHGIDFAGHDARARLSWRQIQL